MPSHFTYNNPQDHQPRSGLWHGRNWQQRSASPNFSNTFPQKRRVLHGWNGLGGKESRRARIVMDRIMFRYQTANGSPIGIGHAGKQFTVKTKTVMHSSKTTTQNWIVALYYVLTARKGVSALQLSKELGVQYRTAWYMMHRIREACASGEFKLSHVVEVDETYIGGKEKNKHQGQKPKKLRGTTGKQAVLGMRERGGKMKAKPVIQHGPRNLVE